MQKNRIRQVLLQPDESIYKNPTVNKLLSYLTIKDWLLYSYDQKYDKDVCSHIYIQHCTEVLVSAVGKK